MGQYANVRKALILHSKKSVWSARITINTANLFSNEFSEVKAVIRKQVESKNIWTVFLLKESKERFLTMERLKKSWNGFYFCSVTNSFTMIHWTWNFSPNVSNSNIYHWDKKTIAVKTFSHIVQNYNYAAIFK